MWSGEGKRTAGPRHEGEVHGLAAGYGGPMLGIREKAERDLEPVKVLGAASPGCDEGRAEPLTCRMCV